MTQETKILLILGVSTVVLLVGAVFFLSKNNTTTSSSIQSLKVVDQKILVRENSHKTATDSTKVTIVEFGDYQCPACAQVYPITKKVVEDYVGTVNFVFRNFPLSQHQNASVAAQAAEAADAQGKFWEMYDKLYEAQNNWADNNNPIDLFVSYANDLGLDVEKFKKDVLANKFSDEINQDLADGALAGVNATPTFYINGIKFEGSQNYNDFKNIIDPILGQ